MRRLILANLLFLTSALPAAASVGDPQIRTDHPWYPGELACSTFPRLFATQAEVYRRVTGQEVRTDHDRALASWLWRNTHYWHGEDGAEDLWGRGFQAGQDLRTREYWTGLFAHGYGLCGTTHSQWVAEGQALFGHTRARGVGVAGHNSFEVFLKGGAYGEGKWALLDHDLSTVIFNPAGSALLSIAEVTRDAKRLTDRTHLPEKQNGWLVCGLHPEDGSVYSRFQTAEYLAGYAGPPPAVHLRRGETLRRYPEPGLDDGKTFVFWGRNYNTAGIPGPERSLTWVNQPEKMYRSKSGVPYRAGQARYANAVYTYRPDFNRDYREGIVEEGPGHVVFQFQSPYMIGATPANHEPWGIYAPGGRNGLVLRGRTDCPVSVSVDRGRTWHAAGPLRDGLDLTDRVKGYRQYWLRLGAGAPALKNSALSITTVCQMNSSVVPRLKDGGSRVDYEASGQALVSAGPTLPQAQAHLVEGAFGTRSVTLELAAPRGAVANRLYAAAHLNSGNPPDPKLKYRIDYSVDAGNTWTPVVQDWSVERRGEDPPDFWSQSLLWSECDLQKPTAGPVRVRFTNDGGCSIARGELHLGYSVPTRDSTRVTFAWVDDQGDHEASHIFTTSRPPWQVRTGKGVRTRWVEYGIHEAD